jgi:hypothetical protein
MGKPKTNMRKKEGIERNFQRKLSYLLSKTSFIFN